MWDDGTSSFFRTFGQFTRRGNAMIDIDDDAARDHANPFRPVIIADVLNLHAAVVPIASNSPNETRNPKANKQADTSTTCGVISKTIIGRQSRRQSRAESPT
jgi:hypothetical protein